MDSVFGLRCRDFVILAADRNVSSSIININNKEDKLLKIDKNKLLGLAGEAGDRAQFGEYIRRNIHLYRLRNHLPLSTAASAQFTRQQLAYFLRRNPYQVNVLVAGYDQDGPSLYWMDYLASMVSVDKGAHGYCAYFLEGLLDRWFRADMSEEEVLDLINKCKKELKERFIVDQTEFVVKIIDKDGVREVLV